LSASSYVARIRTQDNEDNSNNEGHWLPLASLDPDWQEFLSLGLVRVVFDPFKTLVNTFHSQPLGVIRSSNKAIRCRAIGSHSLNELTMTWAEVHAPVGFERPTFLHQQS
jgi:hypothetical protein